jgi:capsular polysaccharide transport system ATP-binding protein
MGIAFDWYLVDELTAVGDSRFKKKSLHFFRNRLKDAGILMVSHSTETIRNYCECGLVIERGRAEFYQDVREAIRVHERNMRSA